MARITRRSFSWSSDPKPSSTNIVSSWMPPAWRCTTSDRPSARASDAMNFSPPESDLAVRALPVQLSSTSTSRPILVLPARRSLRTSSYWPWVISMRRVLAACSTTSK